MLSHQIIASDSICAENQNIFPALRIEMYTIFIYV